MPRDERLFRAARELMLSHRWEATLIDMADIANMSERTFPRHFLRDTGFSFRMWKQRARIYTSLDLLSLMVYPLNRSPTNSVFPVLPRFLLHFVQ